jgi:hypothetical protein
MTEVSSCSNELCVKDSTIICLFSHAIAQLLLTVMTDVDSCPNQLCLMCSTSICLISHDILNNY